MDLLVQVLARLPLRKLPSDERVVRERARVVNRLSEWKGENYAKTCTLQGELYIDSVNWINFEDICNRAAFLRDSDEFIYNFNYGDDFDFDIAMESGVPEIQEMVCRYENINSTNPRRIRRILESKVALREIVLDRLRLMHDIIGDTSYLFGYLYYPNELPFDLGYLESHQVKEGYIAAMMERDSDPFAMKAVVESMSSDKRSLVRAGYFGLLSSQCEFSISIIDLTELALEQIQPVLLEACLDNPGVKAVIEQYAGRSICNGMRSITHSLIDRVNEMLRLESERKIFLHDNYRTLLRVLSGREVRSPSEHAILFMTAVAHPQLTKDTYDQINWDEECFYVRSGVFYDIVNYFKITGSERLEKVNRDHDKYVRLMAYGQLWRVLKEKPS